MKNITAYTYIANFGQTVTAFFLEGDPAAANKLSTGDFTVKEAYRRVPGKTPSDGVTAVSPAYNGIRLEVDPFLFGTDFPMWSPKTELSKFMALKISDSERELILGKNFERLFGVH